MSKTYFISRHAGAHAWADRQGFVAEFVCGAAHNQSLASPFQQARRDPSLLGRVAHSSRITGDVLWT